jgi:rod shape-determining protein MreB
MPRSKKSQASERVPFGVALTAIALRLSRVLKQFSAEVAMELGGAHTPVYVKGTGVVLNEPSVVAVTTKRGRRLVLAVAEEATMMGSRRDGDIEFTHPVGAGVVADFELAEMMIRHFIAKVLNRCSIVRPQIVVCVPVGTTAVELRGFRESVESAGARKVWFIERPMTETVVPGSQ